MTAAAQAAARDRGHQGDPAAPLALPARRPHPRARGGPPHRRAQERHLERALLHRGPGRCADAAGVDPHRGDGPGRRRADPLQAREPLAARLLHGHRPRALPPAGGGGRPGDPATARCCACAARWAACAAAALVDGKVVCEGQMTFALGERPRTERAAGSRPPGALSLGRALSKFGVCSRREAERWIAAGRVA